MDGAKFADRASAVVDTKEEKAVRQRMLKQGVKVGRNDPCPCKSGKKNKHCHNVRRKKYR